MCIHLPDFTVCPCIVFRQEVSRDRLRPAKVSGRSGNYRKYGTALHIVKGDVKREIMICSELLEIYTRDLRNEFESYW